MKIKIKSTCERGIALAFIMIFLAVGQTFAQTPTITIESPPGPVPMGGNFTSKLIIDPGFNTLGSFSIKISYDELVLELESVKSSSSEFDRVVTASGVFKNQFKVGGTNMLYPGCASSGPIEVAELVFKVLDYANPSLDTAISSQPILITDCFQEVITTSFIPPYNDGYVAIMDPIIMTSGLGGYLDVTGDGALDILDALELKKIVNREQINTSNPYINAGGLQGDINGNGVVDRYDVGFLTGVTRNVEFIQSGSNGNVETTAEGDDVQRVPVGPAASNTVCIGSGPNGVIDTIPLGDDTLEIKPKNTSEILNDLQTPGSPAELELVWPPTTTYMVNPVGVAAYFQPVPIVVRVKDKDGTPRLGIAPTFEVLSGTARFDLGQGANISLVNGLPSDAFTGLGEDATGLTSVSILPGEGSSTISITLPPDPSKGVLSTIAPIFINIVAASSLPPPPENLQVLSPPSVAVGDEGVVNLQMNFASGGIEGYAGSIYFTTDRNLEAGDAGEILGLGRLQMIGLDKFETGDFSGGPYMDPWVFVEGGGTLLVDTYGPQFMGNFSVHATGNPSAPLEHQLSNNIDTTFFEDIKVGFGWTYSGDGVNDYVLIEYSPDMGANYYTLDTITSGELSAMNGLGNFRKLDLSAISDVDNNPSFGIRFNIFLDDTTDNITIDNVMVAGKQGLASNDFEAEPVGAFPSSGFSAANRVEAGMNGINQTPTVGDDFEKIPFGQGLAFADAIFPGPDNILNSPPGGDDETTANNTVNTGLNGICETTAQGDDYAYIELGEGLKQATSILPGPNGILDTLTAQGDDLVRVDLGQDPEIIVDDTIGINPGPNQGNGGSSFFLKIGRSSVGSSLESYSIIKELDLDDMENVELEFFSRTLGMADASGAGEPIQTFVVEVSDNGGWNYYTVLDLSGIEENVWTRHKIDLSGDSRFQLSKGFIIRWTATMNSTETDPGDPDAVYLDDIKVTGVPPAPDKFGPVVDDGNGSYRTTISSLVPGFTEITAYYVAPDGLSLPLFGTSQTGPTEITFRKASQGSIQVIPDTFIINACETKQFMVVGRYLDTPPQQIEDMTKLFRLVAYGPASFDENGLLTARCFKQGENLNIFVEAWPRVPGLYDPGGGGGGGPTGYLDGKSMEILYPYNGIQGASVLMEGDYTLSDSSESDGTYFKAGVPVGTYTISAMKQGYVLDSETGIQVLDGQTTTTNLFQNSGTDTDGDTVDDSTDTDDDDDGVNDGDETIQGTSQYDPDHDDDGYTDDVDAFPTDANEWIDTDGDTTGDNSDTDDDGDGISDEEEEIPGLDGYITDPLLVDTDGDTLDDYAEVNTHNTNPTNVDTDGGGRNDGEEIVLARDPLNGADDNTVPASDAGTDQTVDEYNLVGLDGSATTDADADSFTYSWVQAAGPAAMTLIGSTTAYPTFEATYEGTYTFRLDADDGIGIGQDTVIITVNNAATGLPCSTSLYCYGDVNGDGIMTLSDVVVIRDVISLKSTDFSAVYPSNSDTVDVDGSGVVTLTDLTIGRDWTSLKDTPTADDGMPSVINLISPSEPISLTVGSTMTLTVDVRSDVTYDKPRPGVGVVWQVQSGSATLLGGDGDASSLTDPDNSPSNYPAGSRWSTTNDIASGGQASIKVRADASGTIVIRARVPSYSSKFFDTGIYLDITIN